MKFKQITRLAMLLAVLLLNGQQLRSSNSPSAPETTWTCDIPAPATFTVSEIGTDYVGLQWSASSPQPSFYKIRTYISATNALVSTITVPGWLLQTRVFNLTPGETYYSRITPVCGDTESTSSKESNNYTTIIGDLIVSGFQGSSSMTVDCALPVTGLTCPLTNGAADEFRINHKGSQASRRFGVLFNNGVFQTQLSSNGNTGEAFTLYCETLTSPDCYNAKKITIRHNNIMAAQFSVFTVTASNSAPFIKAVYLHEEYTMDKMAPNTQQNGDDDKASAEPAFRNHEGVVTEISPIPFQDYLNIRMGDLNEEASAKVNLYDTQGKLIFEIQQLNAGQTYRLQTQTLKPGLYIVKVELADQMKVYKVIKQD